MTNFEYKVVKHNSQLINPYELSFRTINEFETVYTFIVKDNLLVSVGESTVLPGYSDDTQNQVYMKTLKLVDECEENDFKDYLNFYSSTDTLGFRTVSFLSALEIVVNFNNLFSSNLISAPVIGLSIGSSERKLNEEIPYLSKNYKEIKVKVGKDVSADISKVKHIQNLLPDGLKLRIDANQGYSMSQATNFLSSISPKSIQHIEQPLVVDEWSNMAKLNEQFSDFKFALDESISNSNDIHLAYEKKACSVIKLKLFKCGSIMNTLEMCRLASDYGFEIVLGNGVQNILGTLYEVLIYNRLLEEGIKLHSLESIGFLKNKPVLTNLFSIRSSQLILKPDKIREYYNSFYVQLNKTGKNN